MWSVSEFLITMGIFMVIMAILFGALAWLTSR